MRAANSAAQVSTVLYTGRMPNAPRTSRTVSSDRRRIEAICRSENPCRFARASTSPVRAGAPMVSLATSSSRTIWSRNHGSIPVDAWSSSMPAPPRMACWTCTRRSSVAVPARSTSARVCSGEGSGPSQWNCAPGLSMERRALFRASVKQRPMAMASPTAFMEVVSEGSAPGNFSKVKRGTLTTT